MIEIALGVALGYFAAMRAEGIYYWLLDKAREKKSLERINRGRTHLNLFTFNSMKEYRDWQDASYDESLFPLVYGSNAAREEYLEFFAAKEAAAQKTAVKKAAPAKKVAAPKRVQAK